MPFPLSRAQIKQQANRDASGRYRAVMRDEPEDVDLDESDDAGGPAQSLPAFGDQEQAEFVKDQEERRRARREEPRSTESFGHLDSLETLDLAFEAGDLAMSQNGELPRIDAAMLGKEVERRDRDMRTYGFTPTEADGLVWMRRYVAYFTTPTAMTEEQRQRISDGLAAKTKSGTVAGLAFAVAYVSGLTPAGVPFAAKDAFEALRAAIDKTRPQEYWYESLIRVTGLDTNGGEGGGRAYEIKHSIKALCCLEEHVRKRHPDLTPDEVAAQHQALVDKILTPDIGHRPCGE